ncbi:hypothetical protein SALBM135S_09670 [Streptomyces alboniger]
MLTAIGGCDVLADRWPDEPEPKARHVDLAQWPDTVVVLPATLNYLATGSRTGRLAVRPRPPLLVDAPEADGNWAEGLPGAEVLSREGTRTWLRLEKGADEQRVLHAALATGPVSAFVSEHPPLTELYRDLVTRAGEPGEDAGETARAGATAAAGRTADNRSEDGGR